MRRCGFRSTVCPPLHFGPASPSHFVSPYTDDNMTSIFKIMLPAYVYRMTSKTKTTCTLYSIVSGYVPSVDRVTNCNYVTNCQIGEADKFGHSKFPTKNPALGVQRKDSHCDLGLRELCPKPKHRGSGLSLSIKLYDETRQLRNRLLAFGTPPKTILLA